MKNSDARISSLKNVSWIDPETGEEHPVVPDLGAQLMLMELIVMDKLRVSKTELDRMDARTVWKYYVVISEIKRIEMEEQKAREREARMKAKRR